MFALYGVFGFIGIAIATRIVDSWGAYKTSLLFTLLMLTGRHRMGAQRRHLSADGGLGRDLGARVSPPTNSMQQVRLVAAARRWPRRRCRSTPRCSISARRSARRSAGQLFARDQFRGVGYVAVAFVMLALAAVFLTRPRQPAWSN